MMKKSTLQLVEKLARDVGRADEMCDYNPVFMDIFGSLFLEPTRRLNIIPHLEATTTRHPEEFGDLRAISHFKAFWLKTDPFEGSVYNSATGRLATVYDDTEAKTRTTRGTQDKISIKTMNMMMTCHSEWQQRHMSNE